MTSEQQVDLVVVGLGPGGGHVPSEAARPGMRVVGIDERLVGGEVLAMLSSAVHARVLTDVLREQILAFPTFPRAIAPVLAGLGD